MNTTWRQTDPKLMGAGHTLLLRYLGHSKKQIEATRYPVTYYSVRGEVQEYRLERDPYLAVLGKFEDFKGAGSVFSIHAEVKRK